MNRRPMYNEEQKRAFIADTISNEYAIRRAIAIFRAAAPFEEQWGADLSTVPQVDFEQMLEAICGVRLNSKYAYVSVLRSYMRWCVAHGKDGARELTDISYRENTFKTEETLVRNPAHLQQCLNQVFAPEEECTQDNVYRCFLWLAYGGMPDHIAYTLNASDVSMEYMEASKEDEVAILYRQGLPAIRNCMTLRQFLYYNEHYVNAGPIWRDRVPGTRLLRGIRQDQTFSNFRAQMSKKIRAKSEEGIQVEMLTYRNLLTAGIFYRIYEGEQAGIPADFPTVAAEAKRKYNMHPKPSHLRRDYERWKSVVKSI